MSLLAKQTRAIEFQLRARGFARPFITTGERPSHTLRAGTARSSYVNNRCHQYHQVHQGHSKRPEPASNLSTLNSVAQRKPPPAAISSAFRGPHVKQKQSYDGESWQVQKSALEAKFPTGWSPRKRLSPDAIDGIRALHDKDPEIFKSSSLAAQFKVSPEAIRRILKSKWRPSEQEQDDRKQRWERRGETIWEEKAAQGFKPPRRWRSVNEMSAPKKPRWRNTREVGPILGTDVH